MVAAREGGVGRRRPGSTLTGASEGGKEGRKAPLPGLRSLCAGECTSGRRVRGARPLRVWEGGGRLRRRWAVSCRAVPCRAPLVEEGRRRRGAITGSASGLRGGFPSRRGPGESLGAVGSVARVRFPLSSPCLLRARPPCSSRLLYCLPGPIGDKSLSAAAPPAAPRAVRGRLRRGRRVRDSAPLRAGKLIFRCASRLGVLKNSFVFI